MNKTPQHTQHGMRFFINESSNISLAHNYQINYAWFTPEFTKYGKYCGVDACWWDLEAPLHACGKRFASTEAFFTVMITKVNLIFHDNENRWLPSPRLSMCFVSLCLNVLMSSANGIVPQFMSICVFIDQSRTLWYFRARLFFDQRWFSLHFIVFYYC